MSLPGEFTSRTDRGYPRGAPAPGEHKQDRPGRCELFLRVVRVLAASSFHSGDSDDLGIGAMSPGPGTRRPSSGPHDCEA